MTQNAYSFGSVPILLVLLVAQSALVADDWPMLGRSNTRNPVVPGGNAPTDWDVESGKNIKWSVKLGSMTYGTPVVADGQIYVGTNNAAAYLERYPSNVDLGCLLSFREADGVFLWQFSAEKLPTGRVHDWPLQGLGGSPLVEGDRLWVVSNRWEVVCLDTQGFRDGKNDGPYEDEAVKSEWEADVAWKLDLISQLGVHPHSAGMGPDRRCSVAMWQNRIYVVTGNGVDAGHIDLPSPNAPSLACLDKNTGEVLWTDSTPGENILHTQIASPLVAKIEDQVQLIVPQGDGWLRSFDPETGAMIWEFDINAKTSKWMLGGAGMRNNILATPVLYNNRIYVASGQEAEHGEGEARLVCIDPARTGDISSELAVDRQGKPLPRRRLQAVDPGQGEKAIPNPNSGLVWEFTSVGDDFTGQMHRTLSSVAVHDGLVIAADLPGLVHCLDAETGKRHWAYDMFAQVWASPLIVGNTVYVADQDGEVALFRLSADPLLAMNRSGEALASVGGKEAELEPIRTAVMDSSVYTAPIFADGTLYFATRSRLYAIAVEDAENRDRSRVQGDALPGATTTTGVGKSSASKPRLPQAAFVPTPQDVVERMLFFADVQAGDVVCDLGSGDGRIPIAAAKMHRARGIGYEVDEELVTRSRKKAQTEGVAERVVFRHHDLFAADLVGVDVVTLYLYPAQNRALLPQLMRLRPGVRIIAHHHALPGVQPNETLDVNSKESGETHRLYRYVTPLWKCAEAGDP